MYNKIKRIVIFAIMTISLMSVSIVFANQEEFVGEAQAPLLVSHLPNTNEATLLSNDIYSTLAEGMRNLEKSIDISSFGYVAADVATLSADYSLAINTNYDLYYVSRGYRYSYVNNEQIISVMPIYFTEDKDEIAETVELMDEKIEEILSYTDDSMNNTQKLLTIYDRIILQTQYADTLSNFYAKNVFLDGKAVCQGYATALYSVAKKAGISGGFVKSKEMNHIWNAFFIDGKWYHADATWDDPASNRYAGIEHRYFLKSDDWMLNKGEHRGFTNIGADDFSYDEYFWVNSISPIITISGQMFYIDNTNFLGELSVYNSHTNETSLLYKFKNKWQVSSNESLFDTCSGLAYYDGRLYFNTAKEILSCCLDGTDVRTEHSIKDEDKSIYGCFELDGKLFYEVSLKSTMDDVFDEYCIDMVSDERNSFHLVSDFDNNGRIYISYINESGAPCKLVVFSKNCGRLSEIKIVPISNNRGTVELEVACDSYEIVVINDLLVPLMEKYVNE